MYENSFLIYYLIGVNLLSLRSMGIDKTRALRGYRRIPENVLHLLSISGGSIGSIIGMKYYRHKSKKISFKIIIYTITSFQGIGLYYYNK
jgi:uncharacterized membrane protein YsdA (DUF1294 family)